MPSISNVILAHLRFHPPGGQRWPRRDDGRFLGINVGYGDGLVLSNGYNVYDGWRPVSTGGQGGPCPGKGCGPGGEPGLPTPYYPPGKYPYANNGGGCFGNFQCGTPSAGTNNPPPGKPIDGGSAGVPASN
jgi:hypothetical protein